MKAGTYALLHGHRAGVITGYRRCSRCATGRSAYLIVKPRKWWQIWPFVSQDTEHVCESCLEDTE